MDYRYRVHLTGLELTSAHTSPVQRSEWAGGVLAHILSSNAGLRPSGIYSRSAEGKALCRVREIAHTQNASQDTRSAEGKALCRVREGVPRFHMYLSGRRPANRVMSGYLSLQKLDF